ncbi:MAG: hypothetical protein H0X47_06215 [Nitrospirales bacterium]|nr:hypothetical protein [Nitrospirales bacterium]
MGTANDKRISRPPDLSKELEDIAQEEGKTVSAVIQKALRSAKRERLKSKVLDTQEYWTRKTKNNPDNRVLECADAGQAECIVTGRDNASVEGLWKYPISFLARVSHLRIVSHSSLWPSFVLI